MNQENFSAEQSLQVIQSMIDRAKENVKANSFYFLLWGWLVFIASLTHFALLEFATFDKPWLAWNLMWIGVVISIVKGVKESGQKRVKTYVDDTMSYFGMSLGILYTGLAFIFGKYDLWVYSFPIYILVYAVACFFTGLVMQFSILKWMAIVCLAITVVSVFVSFRWQMPLLALAVLISYIIPGHILRAKEKNQNL